MRRINRNNYRKVTDSGGTVTVEPLEPGDTFYPTNLWDGTRPYVCRLQGSGELVEWNLADARGRVKRYVSRRAAVRVCGELERA